MKTNNLLTSQTRTKAYLIFSFVLVLILAIIIAILSAIQFWAGKEK